MTLISAIDCVMRFKISSTTKIKTGTAAMARTVDEKGKLVENKGAEQVAQELGIVSSEPTEQEAALRCLEQEVDQNKQKAGKVQDPVGEICDEKMTRTEPENCLSAVEEIWWDYDDLHLAHIDEEWGEDLPDNTWFVEEVNHMIRSGRYFKPPHLDQPEASEKDKEAEKQKKNQLEEEAVLKQLKKIQVDISIRGLLMASRVHRQATLSAMDKAKLSIETTPRQLVGLVFLGGVAPTLTFSDKELPPEESVHNKPLYISVECREKLIPVVLVNIWSTINVYPCRWPSSTGHQVPYPGCLGHYQLTTWATLATPSKSCLFRPPPNAEVPYGKGVAIVFGNSSIHPPPVVTIPVLEMVHGEEDIFISGFTFVEAQVVQNIMTIDESIYVSARSGEDFLFCGFLEPWFNSEKQRAPGFEIFFDLQLQDSDTEEQTKLTAKATKSTESDSNSSELKVGAALACLLSDPQINSESLGDNLTISMIRDQQGANPSSEGFLSNSSESSSEPESDSTESVQPKSDSSSSESEFDIPGVDNPDTESVVTKELDELDFVNENTTAEKERFVKPLINEIIAINVGTTEKDLRLVQIGSTLSLEERERLVALLKDFKDVFAWSYEDIPGIDLEIVQHRIPLDPEARPFKQKLGRIHSDWALKIKEEITKQIDTGFLLHQRKMAEFGVCVDFRDLNKASPKDDFSLLHIDKLVDFTAGHALLSFMDGFFGYNQILMAPEDREKTAFTMLRGTYYYRVMQFGLKNAEATYQWVATTILHDMIHKEVEVYVDDMIVKFKEREGHYTALKKFFQWIREYSLRENAGLLDHREGHRGRPFQNQGHPRNATTKN
ncbi:hypothetical protein HYC85_030825 [Camellia sinensis]|uniref:Reverse transcriptase domain-containing protein n=1 Tax=Camellia sinensis TaxID=4442 RepID=A0A7J7G5N6_CAMSI|nr:hypothetical protein HYC85_030825 [Camellia sinensis]